MRATTALLIAAMLLTLALGAHAGPWASRIPDPDTVNWNSTDRPGYHFRGMQPAHERFYAYIQSKRARGEELSWGDEAMIRRMQTARRWPEAPVPNDFWRDFMRYLREQPNEELNIAQTLMLNELVARGLAPYDPPPNPQTQKFVDYLNSKPYRARNWFERCFGRVEPWMDYYMASSGVDMRGGGGPGGGVFPATGDFNGLVINYSFGGVSLGAPQDSEGFTCKRAYTGTVGPGTVTISGSGSINKGWGATLEIYARIGTERIEEQFEITSPGSKAFSYTINVPADADLTWPPPQMGFVLTGLYSTAGAGSTQVTRGLLVSAKLEPSAEVVQAQQDRADAEWRAEVERTLRELGYEETPAGRDVREMREALADGDAAWAAYVDRRQRELGYQEAGPEAMIDEINTALQTGGPTWEQYAAANGGPILPIRPGETPMPAPLEPGAPPPATPPPIPLPTPPAAPPATPAPPMNPNTGDIGGLQVGTGTDGGTTTGVADHFAQASKIAAAMNYEDMPTGSVAVAVWMHNGEELTRTERPLSGTSGWVSFSVYTDDAAGLQPGAYTLTITVGDRILGRKTFAIGN